VGEAEICVPIETGPVEAHPALAEKFWKKFGENLAGIDAVTAATSSSGLSRPHRATSNDLCQGRPKFEELGRREEALDGYSIEHSTWPGIESTLAVTHLLDRLSVMVSAGRGQHRRAALNERGRSHLVASSECEHAARLKCEPVRLCDPARLCCVRLWLGHHFVPWSDTDHAGVGVCLTLVCSQQHPVRRMRVRVGAANHDITGEVERSWRRHIRCSRGK
jgi:hypothetical protein